MSDLDRLGTLWQTTNCSFYVITAPPIYKSLNVIIVQTFLFTNIKSP